MAAMNTSQVLVVGDTEVDLAYAQNIGAASCWAAYGYGRSASCAALAPHFVVCSPTDLLPCVL